MSEELRHLTVDGVRYGWRVTHVHRPDDARAAPRRCIDRFLAFREGTNGAALWIEFVEGEGGGPEYISHHGVVVVDATNDILNLHLPRVAAALIRQARQRGWSGDAPMEVADGFAFAATIDAQSR